MEIEIPVLALSGTVGVGKSAVAGEIHDILSGLSVPHACVDRDALAYSWPAHGRFNETVALQNLEAVWRTFRAHGAARLVVVVLSNSGRTFPPTSTPYRVLASLYAGSPPRDRHGKRAYAHGNTVRAWFGIWHGPSNWTPCLMRSAWSTSR